jgi:hypothetical protein
MSTIPTFQPFNPYVSPQPDKYILVTELLKAIYDRKNNISDMRIVSLLKKIDKDLTYNSEYHTLCSSLVLELVIALGISLDDPKYDDIPLNQECDNFPKILDIVKRFENVRYYN